jgi:hypothetical protein
MPIIIGDSSTTGDTTQVDICNLALRRLGATTISSISESTKNAEHCNVFWGYALDEVSVDYQWNFTKKQVTLNYTSGFLIYATTDEKTITGISAANPAVVTCTSHGFVDDNTVYIDDVAGMTEVNDTVYEITAVAGGNSFQLNGINSTDWTAYTSGGSCYRKEPNPKYSGGYTYDLPSDCLKALHLYPDSTEYEIVGMGANRRLLTTQTDAILVYNMLEETPTNMLTRFVNVLAWRLAAELAIPLTKKGAKQTWAMQMYDYTLKKMATVDAKSEKQDIDQSDSWLTQGGFTV